MSAKQKNETLGKKTGLVFKIIFYAGVLISFCGLFVPAKDGDIIESEIIPNLFRAFTGHTGEGGTPICQMLFGHEEQLINMPFILLEILICYLPIAVMLAAVVFVIFKPRSKLGLIFGLAAAVMFLGIDFLLLATNTSCFGLFLNMTGIIIAVLGLLLFFISQSDDGEEEYEVAGVITCKTGTFAGNTFEIPGRVVIGKNPRECNIVLANKTVSRVHCIINYIPETDTYTVKDVSRNGTFFADGQRLIKNYEMQVKRGTEIYMGDPRETFYLD